MKKQQDKLAKIEFTTGELRKLPPVHAGFFLGSCHAISEINLIQKIYLLALNTRATHRPINDDVLQEIVYAQAVIAQRNLAAKIFEYFKMIGGYKTGCKRKNDPTMITFLNEANDIITNLRGEDYNLALWYRNKVTNHYVADELKSLLHKGNLGDDNTPHPIYLHEKAGNSHYVLGEHILLAKLSENGEDTVQRIDKFDDWILGASEKVMKLHHSFVNQLLSAYFLKKKAEEFPITPEPHLVGKLTESRLPILWDFRPPQQTIIKKARRYVRALCLLLK